MDAFDSLTRPIIQSVCLPLADCDEFPLVVNSSYGFLSEILFLPFCTGGGI